jgi:transposase-like protein
MFKNTHLSAYKIRKIIKCFLIDVTATKATEILGINRNTINRFYNIFRNALSLSDDISNDINKNPDKYKKVTIDAKYFKKNSKFSIKEKISIYYSDANLIYIDINNISVDDDNYEPIEYIPLNIHPKYKKTEHSNNINIPVIDNFTLFVGRKLNIFRKMDINKIDIRLKEYEFKFNNRTKSKEQLERILFKISWKYIQKIKDNMDDDLL